ncbi:hypothetical protein NPIL_375181 [Nephila pilipes]|uniref:Uncharacterized protein n=1 Tax=Nephila pilipes TaxID=299642 RepID=A0A8X6QWE7_NEPPI|nr:hypothetical protein NPIL_375181 [Nephila pilipes]
MQNLFPLQSKTLISPAGENSHHKFLKQVSDLSRDVHFITPIPLVDSLLPRKKVDNQAEASSPNKNMMDGLRLGCSLRRQ